MNGDSASEARVSYGNVTQAKMTQLTNSPAEDGERQRTIKQKQKTEDSPEQSSPQRTHPHHQTPTKTQHERRVVPPLNS